MQAGAWRNAVKDAGQGRHTPLPAGLLSPSHACSRRDVPTGDRTPGHVQTLLGSGRCRSPAGGRPTKEGSSGDGGRTSLLNVRLSFHNNTDSVQNHPTPEETEHILKREQTQLSVTPSLPPDAGIERLNPWSPRELLLMSSRGPLPPCWAGQFSQQCYWKPPSLPHRPATHPMTANPVSRFSAPSDCSRVRSAPWRGRAASRHHPALTR